ncbi:ATP-binding protein [Marinibaculum pumilum]|uniref:histidine kinase n=1 Tax=Marinibaculum pumilum TaxID=1766165 RepID=A0ABV7L979_9PROT
MKLRTKALLFNLGVSATALFLAAVIATAIVLVVRMEERSSRLALLRADMLRAEGLTSELLLDGAGERPLQQWRKLSLDLQTRLLGEEGPLPDMPQLREEFLSRIRAMDQSFERLGQLSGAEPAIIRNVLVMRLRTNKDALLSRIEEIEGETILSTAEQHRWLVAAALAAIAVLLVLAGSHYWVTRRYLLSTYEELGGTIRGLADGQLAVPIPATGSGEAGELLGRLEEMRARLFEAMQREAEQRRRAEDLSRAKSNFVASVSHELRTPLSGLLGRLELAAGRTALPAIAADLALARTAGSHLLALVNQVLDFSRMEAGHFELAVAPFDPDQLVRGVEGLLAAEAAERGLHLRTAFAFEGGEGCRLQGDEPRLRQVLINLVGNAIKFTPSGEVEVAGGVTASGSGRRLLSLTVSDTGPGVPAEARERIFGEFVQLEQSGDATQSGAGLGLAITARIVHRMGGVISVGEAAGGGACFRVAVDLPLAPAAAARESAGAKLPDAPLSVLVVEDVAFNRDIVREFLTAAGHRVEEAGDGREALRRLAGSGPFDVVLMDINMPVMDGIEATRQIRASGADWADLPILGLTANAFHEQVQTYLAAGMTGCLAKPVVWDELYSRLSEVTGRNVSRVRIDRRDRAATPASAAPVVAPVPASPPVAGIVDRQQMEDLLTYLGADQAIASQQEALAHLEDRMPHLPDLCGSPVQFTREVHALAGVASNFGFAALAARLRQLEQGGPGGGDGAAAMADLPDLVAVTRRETERLMATLSGDAVSSAGARTAGG